MTPDVEAAEPDDTISMVVEIGPMMTPLTERNLIASEAHNLATENARLRRVNDEWGLVLSTFIDGLAERGIPVTLGGHYTEAALAEIDRLRQECSEAWEQVEAHHDALAEETTQRKAAEARRDDLLRRLNEARGRLSEEELTLQVVVKQRDAERDRYTRLVGAVEQLADERSAQASRLGPPTDETTGPDRVAWLLCDEDVTRLRSALAATAPQTAPAQPEAPWDPNVDLHAINDVDQWNSLHPVDTTVQYWSWKDEDGTLGGEPFVSRTRSQAWLLGDHTPVVLIEGKSGGVALSHLRVPGNLPAADPEPVRVTDSSEAQEGADQDIMAIQSWDAAERNQEPDRCSCGLLPPNHATLNNQPGDWCGREPS